MFTVMNSTPRSYYLIIHGTWPSPFDWHMPGSSFYDTLSQVVDLGTVSFFLWSGKNRHEERVVASKELVEFIEMFYPIDAQINIIAHSHGGNVAILASQIMGNNRANNYRIHRLYLLATPVSTISYMPDMHAIDYVYNFFSFNDFIQPVFGFFEREYPVHARIANICITLNGKEPDHSQLHDPLIAQWLPNIHQVLQINNANGFGLFDFKKPGIIHFDEDYDPFYEIDEKRQKKRDRDKKILYAINNIMRHEQKGLD